MATRGERLNGIRQNQFHHQPYNAENGGGSGISSTVGGSGAYRQDLQQQYSTGRSWATTYTMSQPPSLDPYIGKLERYELFCTNQCYYLVGCNKQNSQYRVIKMDRTLIERPPSEHDNSKGSQQQQPFQVNPSASTVSDSQSHPNNNNGISNKSSQQQQQQHADAAHNSKPTLRNLNEFLTEDPNVYTQEEIQDMLDMIHDGNRLQREDHPSSSSSSAAGGGGANVSSNGTSSNVHNNSGSGGLKPIAKAYGIVGFIKFLDCYYLTLITRRAKVGSIGGNGIYTIKSTETFPIKPADRVQGSGGGGFGGGYNGEFGEDPSSVLLNMWNRGKRSVGLGLTNREIAELRYQGLYQVVDLTKNFFFSYTYDLSRSLQENFLSTSVKPFPPPPFKDMFAWNFFLTRELEACTNSMTSFMWVMPIIHGAFVQRKLNDYGRSLNVILLARRSRHFAGTRYLKRGVSEQGKVANDVEHEQILHDESKAASHGVFSSFLQIRGSIPTFWTQESSVTMPKPPIELNRVDPTYKATQLHFEDLFKRYGSPIVVVDLVKQSEKREREVRVGNEYRHAIDYINMSIDSEQHKIRYCALDYSHISKHRHLDVSTSLNEVSTWAVNQTGFFCSMPQWKLVEGGTIEPVNPKDFQAASLFQEKFGIPIFPMEQYGILRTNCIDCLDRTNVAQFSAGVEAMEQQLVVMGIRSNPKLDPSSNIVRVLIDLYVDIGDQIALQYGGSEAHKKVTAERSESIVGPIGKHKELLTSIRRYYSNAFTDRLKQDAMNLFLGYYVPFRHTVPLWEMESDYYLHSVPDVFSGNNMLGYQRRFGVVDWNDDEEGQKNGGNDTKSTALRTSNKRAGYIRDESLSAVESTVHPKQSQRINNVRRRCQNQSSALSLWWKVAIHSYIQQRMWMQLGRGPVESMLPTRYERLYQPEKMAQFDRFFARSWATPVRRSHAAEHGMDEGEDFSEFKRRMSRLPNPLLDISSGDRKETNGGTANEASNTNDDATPLNYFLLKHGFEPRKRSTMRRFVQQHDIQDESKSKSPLDDDYDGHGNSSPAYNYVGDSTSGVRSSRYEYLHEIGSEHLQSSTFNPIAFKEFQESLYGMSLNSDDVRGIEALAESNHVGKIIQSGDYKGLDRNTSAIEVSTLVFEQLGAYEKLRSRGQLQEGVPVMEAELERRGFSESVKDTVSESWSRLLSSEKQYQEMVQESSSRYRRSDLSTAKSLKLYTSFFSPDQALAVPDLAMLLGDTPPIIDGRGVQESPRLERGDTKFVRRAAEMGIPIASHAELAKARDRPLFDFDQQIVPAGFEKINEDMYSRKDNKFMVFNGPGVNSYSNTPVTPTAGIDKMLEGTLT